MNKIELRDQVKDVITGFTGIVIARVEYLNGCIQYCVKPKILKEGKTLEGEYIDENQLKIIKKWQKDKPKNEKGGPQADIPKGKYD